jgi:sulfur-carrier protein
VPRISIPGGECAAFVGDARDLSAVGDTVRRLLADLDRQYPGIGDHIRRKMAVVIDGEIHQDADSWPVGPDSEVVLIPKIGGG